MSRHGKALAVLRLAAGRRWRSRSFPLFSPRAANFATTSHNSRIDRSASPQLHGAESVAGVCAAYCAHSPLSLQAVALHFSRDDMQVGAVGHLPATASQAQPLADASDVLRVPLLCFGDAYGEETAAQRLKLAPEHVARRARHDPQPAHALFFRSGAVVFWGVPLAVRRDMLRRTTELFGVGSWADNLIGDVELPRVTAQQYLKRHATTPAPMPIRMEEFEHEFAFHVAEDTAAAEDSRGKGDGQEGPGNGGGRSGGGRAPSRQRRATFSNDQIYLRDLSDTSELLAISYGLAQSVKLHLHEVALDALVQRTERLPVELAQHGRISMSATDIRKLIGELLSARYSVNLVSDILDIPEYLWRRPELEPVYNECKAAVELKQRSRILDARAEVVRDALHILNSELSTAHSVRLERSILFLIGIEVLFEVARFTGIH
jgi:uncharacterized Rmd1/YagE family protein